MRPSRISSALFLFGILSTVISSAVIFTFDSDRRDLEFQHAAFSVQIDIQTTLNSHIELIAQSAAAVSIMPSISRKQFASFVSATERGHTYPAMRAISWIPIIQNDSRPEFEMNASGEGFENFQITQRNPEGQLVRSGVREQYYPVFYIEPLEGNKAAVGFDLGSNQHRLTALSMSMATESTVATSPIELVQRATSTEGFLIFSPVYLQSSGDLSGFISGVFDIDVLVETAILNNQSNGIDFTLFDEEHDPTIPVLSGSIQGGDYIASDPVLGADVNNVSEITLPNRVWMLRSSKSSGGFERSIWLWAVPLLGIISTIGIATSAQMIVRRRETALQLLESEFRRMEFDRQIVDTAGVPILEIDDVRNVTVWNSQMELMTGISSERALGNDCLSDCIATENIEHLSERLNHVLETGEQVTSVEIGIKSTEGRFSRVVFHCTARMDPSGKRNGILIIGQDITERLEISDERDRLGDEKAKLVHQLLQSQEEERGLIAYDLHDGPAQNLSGASMILQSYIAVKDEIDVAESESMILKVKSYVGSALEEIQRIMSGLRPSSLDDLGLVQGLRESANEVSRRTGHQIEFVTRLDEDNRFDETIEIVLYRISQEAVNNAVKHAGDAQVSVELSDSGGSLILKIKDNGSGFDVDSVMKSTEKRGMGLLGMRERAALIGAELTVISKPGDGTLVTITIESLTRGESTNV